MDIKIRILKPEVRNYIEKILKKHDITHRQSYTSSKRVKVVYARGSIDALEEILKKQIKKEQVEVKEFLRAEGQ